MSRVTKFYYSKPTTLHSFLYNEGWSRTLDLPVKNCRRYTMAAIFDDESQTIKFGLAICLPKDNFCKKIGREIAERNALTKPFAIINNFTGRRNDFADEVMRIFIDKEIALVHKLYPASQYI